MCIRLVCTEAADAQSQANMPVVPGSNSGVIHGFFSFKGRSESSAPYSKPALRTEEERRKFIDTFVTQGIFTQARGLFKASAHTDAQAHKLARAHTHTQSNAQRHML